MCEPAGRLLGEMAAWQETICVEHNKDLNLFWESCCEPICVRCFKEEHEHKGHTFDEVAAVRTPDLCRAQQGTVPDPGFIHNYSQEETWTYLSRPAKIYSCYLFCSF